MANLALRVLLTTENGGSPPRLDLISKRFGNSLFKMRSILGGQLQFSRVTLLVLQLYYYYYYYYYYYS